MIIDSLKNAALYHGVTPGIRKALEYLAKTDFSGMAPGKVELDGRNLYALIQHYESKPRDKGLWEAHRRYIDVQYVAEGIESMGHALLETMTVTRPYEDENDYALFSGKGDYVTVRAGMFAVFFPHDVHSPTLAWDAPAPVRKVVVKVAIS